MDLKEATEVMMKFYQSGKMEIFHQVSIPKYSKEMEEQTIKDIESKKM